MKRKLLLAMLASCVGGVNGFAQTVFMDGISVSNDYVRHMGLIDVAGWGVGYTGAVRHLGISYGQLIGVDPSTGMQITNNQNLLPLKVQSVVALSNITAYAGIFGNGIGITNLPTGAYTETDPV